MPSIKTKWLKHIERVYKALCAVLKTSGKYEWGIPLKNTPKSFTPKKIKDVKNNPIGKAVFYRWRPINAFNKAEDELKDAVEITPFLSPKGNLYTAQDLLDWCDILLEKWGYPSGPELLAQRNKTTEAHDYIYDVTDIYNLAGVGPRLKTHIKQELSGQLGQKKAEINKSETPAPQKEYKGQVTFQYNKRETKEGSRKVVGGNLKGKKGKHTFPPIPAIAFAEYARASNEGVDDPKKIRKRVIDRVPKWQKYKKEDKTPNTKYVKREIKKGIKKATGHEITPFNPIPFRVELPKSQ
ncbi:MAG: hypothetical protein ACYSRP_05035 [Planctomycetota bacterium]|jgi:hypothetical protein